MNAFQFTLPPLQLDQLRLSDEHLNLKTPSAEDQLAAAQVEVKLFQKLLSSTPSLVDFVLKGGSLRAQAEMRASLLAAQEQGVSAHGALQLVRADKLTIPCRTSLAESKAEISAAITRIEDLIKRTQLPASYNTEQLCKIPLLSKAQEQELFTAMISHRAAFWAALYKLPMVERAVLDGLQRIVENKVSPERIIFVPKSKEVSKATLIKRAATCLKAALKLSEAPNKDDANHTRQKDALIKCMLRVPIFPQRALLLFTEAKTSAEKLKHLESKIKCRHATLQAAEDMGESGLAHYRELHKLFGGDALCVHKMILEITRLQASYLAIRSYLFTANIRLVLSFVSFDTKLRKNVFFEDLSQEGQIGLLEAIDKFDPTLGWRFATCAYWWIRQATGQAQRHTRHQIVLPLSKSATGAKLLRVLAENRSHIGSKDIAEQLKISQETVIALLAIVRGSKSLNRSVGSEDSLTNDIIEDPRVEPIDSGLFKVELHNTIQQILKGFPERERTFVNMRYGLLPDTLPMSIDELSKHFGMTNQGVWNIEKRVLTKLSARLDYE